MIQTSWKRGNGKRKGDLRGKKGKMEEGERGKGNEQNRERWKEKR